MTPDEAQRHLTRLHPCGCLEVWYMEPPKAIRCVTHRVQGGPCDDAVPPEDRAQALEVLAEADRLETMRRAREIGS